MHKVFISYKAEEFDEANWVRTMLEKNDVSCWMAPMSIQGGSSYATEIPRAIRECTVFVLILSQKAQESKWVPKEVDQAINENKIIMPFMIENCPLEDDFSFYLTNVQRYFAYENKSNAIDKMIKEIKAILDIEYENEQLESKTLDDKTASSKAEETPVKKEKKPEPEKRSPKRKQVEKKKANKKPLKKVVLPIIAAAFAIILVPIMIFTFINNRSVTIAGKSFKVKTSSVRFEGDGKKLTADDISKIIELSEVSFVCLDNCELPDNAVRDLLQMDLYSLSLNNCAIEDSDFDNLVVTEKSVNHLELKDNNLTTLSVLSPLAENLDELYVDNNPITDFAILQNTNLNVLSLNKTGLTDVSVLAENSNLKQLYINDNNIKTLQSLNGLESIRIISLDNNKLSNLSGLEHSLKLEEIYAQSNNLTSLKGLDNATILVTANFNNNKLDDISLLEKSKDTLSNLYVNDNRIDNIYRLEKCINLKSLYIDGNSIISLKSLSECINLEKISASNNKLRSAEGLEKAVNLIYADLSDNNIFDTSALKNIVARENYPLYLDLSNNGIIALDIPTIDYSFLNICGNKISDISLAADCHIAEFYSDYTDKFDYTLLKENDFYNIYIVDCPLDRQVDIKSTLGESKTKFITAEEIDDIIESK